MSPGDWARMRRDDPRKFAQIQALRSLKIWRRNLRNALAGGGFYKADYCEIMIEMHRRRYMEVT